VTGVRTVGLAELTRLADYQTRRDRKYLVPRACVDELLDQLPRARILELDGTTSFSYESVYFDTPWLDSYSSAAKRRPQRFKVRTRAYADNGDCMLEVKVRSGRGNTVKHRAPHPIERRGELTAEGEAFVGSIAAVGARAGQLGPALTTSYRRATYLLDDLRARVTVDVDLRWHTSDGDGLELPEVAIIETKTAGQPSSFDHTLWRAGFRPSTVSKYCTGLAALRPGLPANKWHRILNRVRDDSQPIPKVTAHARPAWTSDHSPPVATSPSSRQASPPSSA
jgi:hypothetical protein